MAVAYKAAVVSLIEELSDDSILQEASSCEDEEFLLFFWKGRGRTMSAFRIISNVLNPFQIFEVIFEFQELQSAVWNTCYLLAQVCLMDKGMGEDIPLTYRSKYWLRYGYLGTLNACDQWPIDLKLQNRFYFVFTAEFVERLPIIFPVNIWSTYLFQIEHRWAKWLISDPSPKGTRWINDPSSDRADQWSDKSLSRVDLINHWSENGFARKEPRKERHRSEILIQIIPKERTMKKTLFLFLSFQWHWLSWRTRLWGSRRGDGFLRLTVEILAILRLTLHFLPLWLD